MKVLGVDTGGTFTDFVLWSGSSLKVHKVLSTPQAPEQAILRGVKELGLEGQLFLMIHGSTVATNAVLERKGVSTVYVTNRGLADVLTIGRQNRVALYKLTPEPVPEPVPASHCIEVDCRIGPDGNEHIPLQDTQLEWLRQKVASLQPQAIAINGLFSYLNDAHEARIAACLEGLAFISVSSRVLPEYKEYERGMATWLNAYVGPLVYGYLQRLTEGLGQRHVSVMQSSGETIAASQAGQHAVRMLLSGPAGGLLGAQRMGQLCEQPKVLTFDMGGTSTDVALIDGDIRLTSEGRIAQYPVAVPMVDMHTIGAGGGSLAWVDAGGMLQVGPESAGASPGPACYGQGGTQATVTDAHVYLGRIQPDAFLGGGMRLDVAACRQAMGGLAQQLGMTPEEAALGIIRVANQHMANALRVISVQRGIDPASFALMSFGGAGGLHVCELAEALGMGRAIVPVHGGVLSAFGMIHGAQGRQLSHSLIQPLSKISDDTLHAVLEGLKFSAQSALEEEGVDAASIRYEMSLDLRYIGQSYTLNVPLGQRSEVEAQFHKTHLARFGYQMDELVELVNVRVAAKGPQLTIEMPSLVSAQAIELPSQISIVGEASPTQVYWRDSLQVDQNIVGPAIVVEAISTTYIKSGWSATVTPHGILTLRRD